MRQRVACVFCGTPRPSVMLFMAHAYSTKETRRNERGAIETWAREVAKRRSGGGPQRLEHLQHMRINDLNLEKCNGLTDAGLVHLRWMPPKKLNLAFCDITDNGLAHLQQLPLHTLKLARCAFITDLGLAYIGQIFTISKLDLRFCNITDAGLFYLKNLPLKILNLGSCKNITDQGLCYLQHLHLNELMLVNCVPVLVGSVPSVLVGSWLVDINL